ncbi:50S ribosomal protein L17 [bacterium]|mgnify:FL=1|nr:50S ribosomal protein L17 [bacterium]|tara:strand:- start:741 stop:1187 length:447 start_codon:yes stop_codon:yes gene_type:complete
MRHLLHKRKLGSGKNRSKGARNSLLRNFAASLILEGKIETTFAKAKVINSYVDSIASRAKKSNDKNNIRYILKKLPSGQLGEKASRRLFSIVSKLSRSTGFFRIVKTKTRLGDSSQMAIVTWVDNIDEGVSASDSESTKKEEVNDNDK